MFSICLAGGHNVLYNPAGSGIVAVLKMISAFRINAVSDAMNIVLIRNLTVLSSAAIPISAHHRRSIEPKCRTGILDEGIIESLMELAAPNVISSGILMGYEIKLPESNGVAINNISDMLCAVTLEEY